MFNILYTEQNIKLSIVYYIVQLERFRSLITGSHGRLSQDDDERFKIKTSNIVHRSTSSTN